MKKNLSIAALFFLVMLVVMQWQGSALKSNNSKLGIVNLEFADTPAKLHQLLQNWDMAIVKMNIRLDFLFIIAYVAFFALSLMQVASMWAEGFMRNTGMVLAGLIFAAGIFDIAENLLMLQSINGNYTDASLILTWYCAAIKFLVIAFALIYLLLSLPKTFTGKN